MACSEDDNRFPLTCCASGYPQNVTYLHCSQAYKRVDLLTCHLRPSHVFSVRLPLCSKKNSALSLQKCGTSTQVNHLCSWTAWLMSTCGKKNMLYLKVNVYSCFYIEIIRVQEKVWTRLPYTEGHLWLRRLGSYVGFLPWLLFQFLLVIKTSFVVNLSCCLRCWTLVLPRWPSAYLPWGGELTVTFLVHWKRTTSSIKFTIQYQKPNSFWITAPEVLFLWPELWSLPSSFWWSF